MLLGNVPGVAAYFSSADAYSSDVSPRSNEHEMIYLNLNGVRPGQQGFDSTVTHELQHMAHFARCPGQESWVDEGAAELASRVAGYNGAAPQAFSARPDVQLTAWSSQPADLSRHYQAAYLFVRYVAERGGGWDVLPRLFETCARGEALFNSFLQGQPLAADFDNLFTDWTVANLLQDASVGDGRFAYARAAFRVNTATGRAAAGVPWSAPSRSSRPTMSTCRGDGSVTFSGETSVALLGGAHDSSPVVEQSWRQPGCAADSPPRPELACDATLRFRAWYDLEPEFDFVYLSASTDGGQTWSILPGRHTAADSATATTTASAGAAPAARGSTKRSTCRRSPAGRFCCASNT